MLEVEPTTGMVHERGQTVTGSGRNSNEAVADSALHAFARRLHRRYAPVKLPSSWHIVSPRDTMSFSPRVASEAVSYTHLTLPTILRV